MGRRCDKAAGRIDVLGAVTVTAATGSLTYGMIHAGDAGWADPARCCPSRPQRAGDRPVLPVFVCATTAVLGRAGRHEAGLVAGVVQTFNQLGAATCVAVASTVAAAGLARAPSLAGFTHAFTVFAVVAPVAAVVAQGLVPSGTPQVSGVLDAR